MEAVKKPKSSRNIKTSESPPSSKRAKRSAVGANNAPEAPEAPEARGTTDRAVHAPRDWEAKALELVEDPDFMYSDADPDAKHWDAAFAALQQKGLMTIERHPKNPNDSLFVLTHAGRAALSKP